MAQDVTIFICDTEDQADHARGVLTKVGYPSGGISASEVDDFLYDAMEYDGGTKDAHKGKWLVIGRK